MRNVLFKIVYFATSAIVAILAMPLLLWPGRRPMMKWMQLYSRAMKFWMRTIAGIEVEYRGTEKLPAGPCIIAAKHQSWGDGYCMFSVVDDLAFVTGDHLEKYPLVGRILDKMGAIVVASCGGVEARTQLMEGDLAAARQSGRRVLIYPEGKLVEAGYHATYKKGVFHMYEAYGCPVLPVATNLGLYWPKYEMTLKPGTAVVEFLEPIPPGLGKEEFMALLQERIETASLALLPPGFPIPEQRELQAA